MISRPNAFPIAGPVAAATFFLLSSCLAETATKRSVSGEQSLLACVTESAAFNRVEPGGYEMTMRNACDVAIDVWYCLGRYAEGDSSVSCASPLGWRHEHLGRHTNETDWPGTDLPPYFALVKPNPKRGTPFGAVRLVICRDGSRAQFDKDGTALGCDP